MKKLFFFSILSLFILSESFAVDFNDFDASVGIVVVKRNEPKTLCSGVLLSPKVVLTVGHCADQLEKAWVIDKEKVSDLDYSGLNIFNKHKMVDFKIHPGFTPGVDTSTDVALIYLDKGFDQNLHYPTIALSDQKMETKQEVERIGFGLRSGANKRTWQTMFIQETYANGYVKTQDAYGVGGDSGGPVYFRNRDKKLMLLGLHTGRVKDSQGKLIDSSFFISVLNPKIREWILKEMNYRR